MRQKVFAAFFRTELSTFRDKIGFVAVVFVECCHCGLTLESQKGENMQEKKKKPVWLVGLIALLTSAFAFVVYVAVAGGVVFLIIFAILGGFQKEGADGFFKYRIRYYDDTEYAVIYDLTDEGMQQEVLFVPQTLDGRPVREISSKKGFWSDGMVMFSSDKLQRLYFTKCIPTTMSFGNCPSFQGVFVLDFNTKDLSRMDFYNCDAFIFPEYYEQNKGFFNNFYSANVVYYLTPDEQDGYWLDKVTAGKHIVYLPYNPERTGYEFDGWYAEPQCVNKWDFDNDTMPSLGKNEVLKLYAKWIEK